LKIQTQYTVYSRIQSAPESNPH